MTTATEYKPGFPANVGARLRWSRERVGLTQGQVAKLLGLRRPSVTEMELGGRKMSAEEAVRLSKIYTVSIIWLITGGNEA